MREDRDAQSVRASYPAPEWMPSSVNVQSVLLGQPLVDLDRQSMRVGTLWRIFALSMVGAFILIAAAEERIAELR